MRLITRGRRAPLGTDTTLTAAHLFSPVERAIDWLGDKLSDGAAALDPYDLSILVLDTLAFERVWGYRCAELCGVVMGQRDRADGGRRIRILVEADVRVALGLDKTDAPIMADVPLASRGVDAMPGPAFAQPLRMVPAAATDEPESMLALHVARAAYDRRYPEGLVS